MAEKHKYDFSFVAASLRLKEQVIVLEAEKEHVSKDEIIEKLGSGKIPTGKRLYSEFYKRSTFYTDLQKETILSTDLNSQQQLAFLAITKTYKFIAEFVIEVLREKVLIFDYQLNESDYNAFFRRKNELYEELDLLTDLTKSKIRQVIFKMLEGAGWIDSVQSKVIQPQFLSEEVLNAVVKDNPEWLKIFFWSDIDIENAKK